MDRRAEREALAQEITSWEEEVLFAGKKDQMRAMWEVCGCRNSFLPNFVKYNHTSQFLGTGQIHLCPDSDK